MIKETSAETGEAMDRVEAALSEAEQARAHYDEWMAQWRKRNGHLGEFDPDTGLPVNSIPRAAE
jgi:hypothetical protein